MAESQESGALDGAASRRRRRRSPAPVETVAAAAQARPPGPEGEPQAKGGAPALRPPRWQRWARAASSFGLSSTFRAYLFVASVLAILAFLLYSESLIDEFKEDEKDRVGLYAALYALAASADNTEQTNDLIFRTVISNPRDDFPIIFTDYKGELTYWKGKGTPDMGDTSAAARQVLRELLPRMDAQNMPIPYVISPTSEGLLHHDRESLVVTNSAGEIAGWRGPGLPAEGDTTAAAMQLLRAAIARMDSAVVPRSFEVPHSTYHYLHGDGESFVVADIQGGVVTWGGADLPERGDMTPAAVERVRELMLRMDIEVDPCKFKVLSAGRQYIHYGDSELVSRFSWGLHALIGGVLLLFLVGYVGFRNIRRSELRSIWVGMAKETAHQLGTPLSSLSGWLELIAHELDAAPGEDEASRLERIRQQTGEMQNDMQRLNQIASRFSQIGSVPELKMADVGSVLTETIAYFRNRGSQFGRYDTTVHAREVPLVPLNAELMSWAFENLFKNGMDAIGREDGTIDIHIGYLAERNSVQITFQDNGRGIEAENVNRVFEPGFSTKKRGWGLGLTFVRRIIEEYHRGKISITRSVPGEGTTFEILLPAA